jgi:hypothetical protein
MGGWTTAGTSSGFFAAPRWGDWSSDYVLGGARARGASLPSLFFVCLDVPRLPGKIATAFNKLLKSINVTIANRTCKRNRMNTRKGWIPSGDPENHKTGIGYTSSIAPICLWVLVRSGDQT